MKTSKVLSVIIIMLGIILSTASVYMLGCENAKMTEYAVVASHGEAIAEQFDSIDNNEIDIAERIAVDIKQHMSYDYSVTKPWLHNLDARLLHTARPYASYLTGGKGICTDFALVYTAMLHGAGLHAEYIDRVKVNNNSEHAYVLLYVKTHTYRIDITSFCTAELHEASTSFYSYIDEY